MKQRKTAFMLLLVATLLSLVSVSTAGDTGAQAAFRPGNLIRLHVIANSDSDEDQATKLRVRDAVLKAMEVRLADKANADEVYTYLVNNDWVVRSAVDSVMAEAPTAPKYGLEFGEFDFPDRVYGDMLVPAGRYRALRIILGEGKGRNWWCVLFPPLCFSDLTTESVVTSAKVDEARRVLIIDEGEMRKIRVEYRLKLLEWLRLQHYELNVEQDAMATPIYID